MKKFKCPCCGKLTLEQEDNFEICDVCGWEDDNIQRSEPDFPGGANPLSLNQARKAFAEGKNLSEIFQKEQERYFAYEEEARKIAESRGEKFSAGHPDRWLKYEEIEWW